MTRFLGFLAGCVTVVAVSGAVAVSATQPQNRESDGTTAARSPVPLELFKTWNFDKQPAAEPPAGFSSFTVGSAEGALWMVQPDPNAPSKPNIIRQSALCSAAECMHGLLVDDLIYDYADITVRVRLAESAVDQDGSAGIVFGARDAKNFYAVTVDLSGEQVQLLRVADGHPSVLAETIVNPKPVPWHVLRVRRDTIISKEFIEVVYDGVHVLSYERTKLPPGQIGVLTRGPALVSFDSLNASPLYSQKPLSPPAAY